MREQKTIGFSDVATRTRHSQGYGFTLIELLVVISVISFLMGILLSALGAARRQVRGVLCANNQREIVHAVINYASDHDERYPPSMATVTDFDVWRWQHPTMISACQARPSWKYRAMSSYLGDYIRDARILSCPSIPRQYRYLQTAWQRGEEWNHPETSFVADSAYGSYCLYWNYVGFLGNDRPPFKGPRGSLGGRAYSKLLVSDYFGYDHHRSPKAYGSSERFRRAVVIPETETSPSYWARLDSDDTIGLDELVLRLHAGYTDGHVERFRPSEVVPMKVSKSSDGSVPYDSSGIGENYGDIFIPQGML